MPSLRETCPESFDPNEDLAERYVDPHNTVRPHSAIGFAVPADMLAGRQKQICDARDWKLEEARHQRQLRRQQAA